LEHQRDQIVLQSSKLGLDPELVVVFDVIKPLESFAGAVKAVGWEFLLEGEEDAFEPDEDFYFTSDKEDEENASLKLIPHQVYAIMVNPHGVAKLLELWRTFQKDKTLSGHPKTFRELFECLHDVRVWGIRERMGDWSREEWLDLMRGEQGETVRLELELWYRKEKDDRKKALSEISKMLEAVQGRKIAESEIPEIRFHGILLELPKDALIKDLENSEVFTELIFESQTIQFIHPQGKGQAERIEETETSAPKQTKTTGQPIVALLDGLPLARHQWLEGGLVLDDPDDLASKYQAGEHSHGTAMASLILHGPQGRGPVLPNPIYVRPVMIPDRQANDEEAFAQQDQLFVDLIYRTVRRIFEDEGAETAAAASVRIINFSLGDERRIFLRHLSALARLIDWLSFRYRVLFVISSGNYKGRVSWGMNFTETDDLTGSTDKNAVARQQELTMRHVLNTRLDRRIISPAESINGLTVGSQNHDESPLDPFYPPKMLIESHNLPSLTSRFGLGFRRSIKPDLLAEGGMQPVDLPVPFEGAGAFALKKSFKAPGHKVAAPGKEGELDATAFTRGSSNAAALTTRRAAILYKEVRQLQSQTVGDQIDKDTEAVLLKAFIIHQTSLQNSMDELNGLWSTEEPNSKRRKTIIASVVGFGLLADEAFLPNGGQAVTLVACGLIRKEQGLIYEIPIPKQLAENKFKKRLTLTAAYFSPTTSQRQAYRKAKLMFEILEPTNLKDKELGIQIQERGTVFHRILTAQNPWSNGLKIKLSCKEDAKDLVEQVPFALIATLEIAEAIDIYTPIAAEVHAIHLRQVQAERQKAAAPSTKRPN